MRAKALVYAIYVQQCASGTIPLVLYFCYALDNERLKQDRIEAKRLEPNEPHQGRNTQERIEAERL